MTTLRMRSRLMLLVVLCATGATAQEAAVVRGRVLAADTGAPLAGARVSLGGLPVHVRADGAGLFEMRLPPGGPPLAVDFPGYARAMLPRPPGTDTIELRLVRAAALTVHVVDRQGEPVAGTNIRMTCANGTSVGPSNDLGYRRDGHLQPGRCGVAVGNIGAWLRIAGEPTIDQLAKTFEQLRTQAPAANEASKIGEMAVDLRAGEEATLMALDVSPPPQPTVTIFGNARPLPDGAGAIRGRILGPGRRPVAEARVTIASNDGSRTTISGPAGDYAIENLPAGRFRIRVSRPGLVSREYGQLGPGTVARDIALGTGERLSGMDVTLTRGNAISGVVTGDDGRPIEGIGVQLFRLNAAPGQTRALASLPMLAATDDRGQFRLAMVPPGTYYVGAVLVGGRRAQGPVYFPGRVDVTDAVPVPIEGGLDATEVNIPFTSSLGARVHGTVYAPDGQLLDGGLVQLVGFDVNDGPVLPRTSEIDAGRFEFLNLPEGRYALSVRWPASTFVSVVVRNGQVSRSDGPAALFGRTSVIVGRTGPPALSITTSSGSTLSGRIELEGNDGSVTPSSFRLAAYPGGRVAGGIPGGSFAEIGDDWRFDMTGIGEPAWFNFTGPPGWWLKSLAIDGEESADRTVPFGEPEESKQGAVAVFSRTAAEISGAVTGAGGRVSNFLVVVFSVDAQVWFPMSRRVHVGRPNQAGEYLLRVPPGQYYIAAVDALGPIGQATLGSVVPFADPITVRDNERLRKDLRLVALPR